MLSRFAFALAFIAACGGEAVIDPPLGTGGSSGTTSSGGSGTTSSAVTNVAVSSSTGVMDLCPAACASLSQCGAPPPGCEASCQNAQGNPICGQAHEDFVACSLGEIASMCGSVPALACATSLNQWLQCTSTILTEDCAVSPQGDCACNAFVSPGIELDQFCSPGAGCDCFIGGQLVGTCEPNDEACGISNGCCAGLFFTAPF